MALRPLIGDLITFLLRAYHLYGVLTAVVFCTIKLSGLIVVSVGALKRDSVDRLNYKNIVHHNCQSFKLIQSA